MGFDVDFDVDLVDFDADFDADLGTNQMMRLMLSAAVNKYELQNQQEVRLSYNRDDMGPYHFFLSDLQTASFSRSLPKNHQAQSLSSLLWGDLRYMMHDA